MADQSSGTPRPLGARPFARPHAGPAGAAQPTVAKTTPARHALPPFAPAAVVVAESLAEAGERAAPNPEPEASQQVDFSGATRLATDAALEVAPSHEVEAPVAADVVLPEASEPEPSTDERPTGDEAFPARPSSSIWTPEWTPVVVSDLTDADSLVLSSTSTEEAFAIEDGESDSTASKSTDQEPTDAADLSSWAAQHEETVPLFRDAEDEPAVTSDRSAPLGHWTNAPSAEDVHPYDEAGEAASRAVAGPPAPTMEDVSGLLDDSPLAVPSQPAVRKDDDWMHRAEATELMHEKAVDRDAGTKERQYADVLEAVASRVRAGEIQLPVAPGSDDEAAILAAVLASLLSSR